MTNIQYQPTEEEVIDLAPDAFKQWTYDEIIKISDVVNKNIIGSNIKGGTLVVGSGDNVLKYDSRYGFWLGDANFVDAPFSVAMTGTVIASDLTLTGGTLKYGKTSFSDTTNPGYYISSSGIHFGESAASYLKYTIGGSLEVVGSVIDGTSTIDGRTASILATAIDDSGHFADSAISTATGTILGEFSFSGSGAIQIGTYEAGVTGDIKISPTGILGRDNTGATTFSINATTGVAVLNGLVVGTNVGLGTAKDSAGVTTIIGDVVTTGFVNALNVTAQYVAASISITSPTITGGTVQSAASGLRTKLTSDGLWFGNNDTKYAGIDVEYDAAGDGEGLININTLSSGLEIGTGLGVSPTGFFSLGASSVGISGAGKSTLGSASINFDGDGIKYFGISWSGGDVSTKQMSTDLRMGSHWLPHVGNSYDLGSVTYEWKNLYIDGQAFIDYAQIDAIGATLPPNSTDTYDLGTSTKNWRSIYLMDSTSQGIYFGTTKMIGWADASSIRVDGNFHLYTGSIDIKNTSSSIAWGTAWVLSPVGDSANLRCNRNFISQNHDTLGNATYYWGAVHCTDIVDYTPKWFEKNKAWESINGLKKDKKTGKIDKKNLPTELKYPDVQEDGESYGMSVNVLLMSFLQAIKDLDNRLKKVESN